MEIPFGIQDFKFYLVKTEGIEEEVTEIVTPRTGPTTPEELFFADLRGNAVFSAYEDLPIRQRMVTSDFCGFCDGCYGVQVLTEDKNGEPLLKERKALMLTQIAARNHLSDADTVKTILNKAIAAMREYLHGTDYFATTVVMRNTVSIKRNKRKPLKHKRRKQRKQRRNNCRLRYKRNPTRKGALHAFAGGTFFISMILSESLCRVHQHLQVFRNQGFRQVIQLVYKLRGANLRRKELL